MRSYWAGLILGGAMSVLPMPTPAVTPADDPYLWLEDVEGAKALDWAKQQNSQSQDELADSRRFRKLESRILGILDSDARIPEVGKVGAHYYNFWKDKKNTRGLWRRTTLAEYRKAEPAWETVLDLDALATAEKENWVWHGYDCLRPAFQRCLIKLSRGGADAEVTREFDLVTKALVKDGFYLPEAKGTASWIDLDNLFVYTDFGAGTMTSSGYPRVVKKWRRGTPLAQAETIFEGKSDDVAVSAGRDHTTGFVRDFVERNITFYTTEKFELRDGKLVKIDIPADAAASVYREWLLITLRSDWDTGGRTYPAGALLAVRYEEFMAGQRQFELLFEPSERRSLAGFSPTRNHLLVNELDNVRNRVYVLNYRGERWHREALPGMPEFGTVSAQSIDADVSDDYFLTVTDFLTPTSLYFGSVGQGAAQKIKSLPDFFETEGLQITQHEAQSKDGTRVPYFQVASKKLKTHGKNPTLVYGYGGFEVSETPEYSASVGAAWLEAGGVYALANIRGGGEFGPRWHQAALKEKRHKAYEDFIAVAEDLVRRKVTTPKHLGIMGGSNGGLLMGNMLTLRPDLFGAIVCAVPLLDMRRYHTLLAGASWMGEYGNPDDPKEWQFIQIFSPYHNVKQGIDYPPMLVTTSTRDDRVHPGHARKMVAKMKAQGHEVLYYENIEGGHGGSANNKQRAFMSALAYAFLWKELK